MPKGAKRRQLTRLFMILLLVYATPTIYGEVPQRLLSLSIAGVVPVRRGRYPYDHVTSLQHQRGANDEPQESHD